MSIKAVFTLAIEWLHPVAWYTNLTSLLSRQRYEKQILTDYLAAEYFRE